MPIAVSEIMEAICTIASEDNIKVTVTQAARGGLIAGVGAVVGGLVAGPPGMAIGGTVGSIVGAATAKDFKPLVTVLRELPVNKQQEVADRVNNVVQQFHPHDLITLLAVIQGSISVRSQVLGAVKDYLNDNMGMTLQEC